MKELETENLRKGDYFIAKEMEELLGVNRRNPKFGFRMMALISRIQRESRAMGHPLLCRQDCYGLKVMTDREAVEYKVRRRRRIVGSVYTTRSHLDRISISRLSHRGREVLQREKIFLDRVCKGVANAFRRAF